MLKVNAFYERYVEIGLPNQNLIGLGAGLSF
jgi:transketolase C-terminal domain/subunit